MCRYRFPVHPREMFERSLPDMSEHARHLRVQLIQLLAELSQSFTQEDLDRKVVVDVQSDGDIVGLSLTSLFTHLDLPDLCVGARQVPLGDLTADAWTAMRVT